MEVPEILSSESGEGAGFWEAASMALAVSIVVLAPTAPFFQKMIETRNLFTMAAAAPATTLFSSHDHPLRHTHTGLAGHFCDVCRATNLEESFRCDRCNFDMCGVHA